MGFELKLLILLLAMAAPEPAYDCAKENQFQILVGWETVELSPTTTARVPLYRCAVLL